MDGSEGAARGFILYNTSPQGKCLYEFEPGAGGVMRYKDWQNIALKIFIVKKTVPIVITHVRKKGPKYLVKIDFTGKTKALIFGAFRRRQFDQKLK